MYTVFIRHNEGAPTTRTFNNFEEANKLFEAWRGMAHAIMTGPNCFIKQY